MNSGSSLWLILLLWAAPAAAGEVLATRVIDLRALPSLGQILPALADKRVVFVGESHDQYSHHMVQLAVIRGLHERHPDLVIGMEQFQQPFQRWLDAYIAGEIDETTMLRNTEYFDRWRFDYRLYRPILQYAREQKIPVVALNVPRELTTKVAAGGLESLSAEEKAKLPEIDRSDEAYRERVRSVFAMHPSHENGGFDHFLEAQLLWDEGMAARAAEYLNGNPAHTMVVLAGMGHVAWRNGIPMRLERRAKLPSAVLVSDPPDSLGPDVADFALFPETQELPPKGMMGLLMEPGDDGVRVGGFGNPSAAQSAGVEKGDRIVEIDGNKTATPADVSLLMMDRQSGETVELAVLRRNWLGSDKLLHYRVHLR